MNSNLITEFFVRGKPATGGSKSYRGKGKNGRAIISDSCKRNRKWKALVALHAKQSWDGPPVPHAIVLRTRFLLARPKADHVAGDPTRPLKARAPQFHVKLPDLTKLLRPTEDAMKGIVFTDDSVIVEHNNKKTYSADGAEGVFIEVLFADESMTIEKLKLETTR